MASINHPRPEEPALAGISTDARLPCGSKQAPLLALSSVDAYYALAQILFAVEFEVAAGEIVALLGRNGAGKSTTLKAIIGLVRIASGEIAAAGRRIDDLPSHQIGRLGIGYVPEDRRIFTDLTVVENLEVGRQPPRSGAPHWTLERLFQLFPNLAEMRNRPGGRMSGGEQQMLTIARTLMGNPRLLLLDEPSEGLAPKIVEQMAETILHLKQEGLTVVLSEQNLYFAMLSDRAVILEKGHVRYNGTTADLARREDVQLAYLGA
jgi:branched-chain amino acid transport system ATP-binding protein